MLTFIKETPGFSRCGTDSQDSEVVVSELTVPGSSSIQLCRLPLPTEV